MDERSRLLGFFLIGALVMGGLFYRPTGPTQSQNTEPETTGSESVAQDSDGTEGDAPTDLPQGGINLLAEFLNLPVTDGDDIEFGDVETALRDAELELDFVIATIPDWIDSNARWLLDGILDAMQRAMGQSGYVLDRYYFPDLDPRSGSASSDTAAQTAHERTPGAILFREADWSPDRPDDRPQPDLVLLFLVPETATFGIHPEPFIRAVRLIMRSRQNETSAEQGQNSAGGPIRVVGPTFSGSSPSLRLAIDAVSDEFPDESINIDIVSGSATWEGNQTILEGEPADSAVEVQFKATVLPDDLASAALLEYVKGMFFHGEDAKIARLVESNTAYGRSFSLGDDPTLPTLLPFPLHVSRLRGETTGTLPATVPSQSESVPLDLADSGPTLDRLPTFAPETTLPQVELELANTLAILKRERFTAVGLFATDARDKLFLAREVLRQSPNVLLFTLESDLLFTHTEYAPYMRGAVVASTYPLFNATQLWTNPQESRLGRQQFASMHTQGIYNALIVLLNYTLDGQPLFPEGGAEPPSLLDYSPPTGCEDDCFPPLWISVVGRDGLWPVKHLNIGESGSSPDYVWHLTGAGIEAVEGIPLLHPSRPAVVAFVILSFIVALHAVAYRLVSVHPNSVPVFWRPSLTKRTHRRYLLGTFLGLAFAGTACNILFLIWLWTDALSVDWYFLVLVAGLTLLAIGGGVWNWIIVGQLIRSIRLKPSTPMGWLCAGTVSLLLAVHTVPGVLRLDFSQDSAEWLFDGWTQVFHFERATNPSNWLSPIVPSLIVAALIYSWSLMNLYRLKRPKLILGKVLILRPIVPATVRQWQNLQKILKNPNDLPSVVVIFIALLTLIPKLFIGHHIVSVEGFLSGELIDMAMFAVQFIIILTLVQAVRLWTCSRRILDSLEHHPMAEAYRRIPKGLLGHPVTPKPPRAAELQLPVTRTTELLSTMQTGPERDGDVPKERLLQALREHARELTESGNDLAKTFQIDRDGPRYAWSGTHTWRRLCDFSRRLVPCLEKWWLEKDQMTGHGPVEQRQAISRWFEHAEELVAINVVFCTREVLYRVFRMLTFVVVAQVFLLGSHVFFPFQQRQLTIGLDWTYLVLTIGATLVVFAQIDHHRVLSRISSEKERHRLSGDLLLKILLYAILPLLALFATYFPEIGGGLFEWLQRIESPSL